MGYGGHLIWTGVFRNINISENKPVFVAGRPQLTDLLCGRLFNSKISFQTDIIFKDNPRLIFNNIYNQNSFQKLMNSIFNRLLRFNRINFLYESILFAISEIKSKYLPYHIVHVDLLIHSYVKKILPDRYIWVNNMHWIDYLTARFVVKEKEVSHPELFFHIDEKKEIKHFIIQQNFRKQFIVVEPNTKSSFFGNLRDWPMERWQIIIERLNESFPLLDILQVGLDNSNRLPGTIDLRGMTTFRQCVLLIKNSILFLGSEGGLTHAARSINADSIIIWGGISLPDFAGYLDNQRVISKYVECAPCGNLGWCNNDHICMKNISVNEVWEQVNSFLLDSQVSTNTVIDS